LNNLSQITIAIDGPAASGKSTTARGVAHRLKYIYIDSGAMYRAVTLKVLREGISIKNKDEIIEIAANIQIRFERSENYTIIFMNSEDVSEAIRTPEIDKNISKVAAIPQVREILVQKQRAINAKGGVVMEGRDIGTVVFPFAELKIFLLAGIEERAKRRQAELYRKGIDINYNKIINDIIYRDLQDENRMSGPLKKAPDAIEIDTTKLTIEEQIQKIVELAKKIIKSET
jgi:cytidylate kinase